MKTCLIVDDSGVIRKASRRMLEELEFKCSEAENGQVAVDSCARAMPNVILLDWNMPVMDGLDCLKAIRHMPGGDAPRIVLCTTVSEIKNILEALEEGADEYIMKPFDKTIVETKFHQIGVI